MSLSGARPSGPVAAGPPLPGVVNVYSARDRVRWRTGIERYAAVRYRDVYPGVDLVWSGSGGRLEYSFELRPGADPRRIRLAFGGRERGVWQHRPAAYQGHSPGAGPVGRPRRIPPRALRPSPLADHRPGAGLRQLPWRQRQRRGPRRVARRRRQHLRDRLHQLRRLPDGRGRAPGLLRRRSGRVRDQARPRWHADLLDLPGRHGLRHGRWRGRHARRIGVRDGTHRIGGLPTANALQPAFNGGRRDLWVAKLDPAGALAFSTYLGGTGYEWASGIATDASSNVYVTGHRRPPTNPRPARFRPRTTAATS